MLLVFAVLVGYTEWIRMELQVTRQCLQFEIVKSYISEDRI